MHNTAGIDGAPRATARCSTQTVSQYWQF